MCLQISAQDFYGHVKKADSTGTPIYQASVEISEGGKVAKTIKSYFDGGYKFTPAKEQTYSLRISYEGYKDTTLTFTTDKKGVPSAQNITVRLQKDGMRLLGVIKSRDENFPIKEATIILKNVMTRKEERITTDIDGRYNFKLEYETNYRVTIDKRSTGIFNKYKDTTFYISTVGFNLPLDYKLDIVLDRMLYAATTAREGYDATKAVNGNVKPVLAVKEPERQPFAEADQKLKKEQEANARLQAELEKTKKELEELKKKETEKKPAGGLVATTGDNKKAKDKEPEPEVVVIKDEPVNNDVAAAKAKFTADSIARVKADLAAREQAKQDSIARVKAEQEKAARELATRKVQEDSISKVTAAVGAKVVADSIAHVKAEAAAREKAKQDSIARVKTEQEKASRELATQKAHEDSINKVIAAVRAKAIADSIAHVKAEAAAREKAAKELIAQKKREDSITRVVRTKFVADSIVQAKATATAREKARQDSLARVKIEKEKAATEAALQKAKADSLNRVIAAVRAKQTADSIARVNAELSARAKAKQDSLVAVKKEKERVERELALRKAHEDSLQQQILALKEQARVDSIKRVKAELAAAKAKAREDSVLRAKEKLERIAMEQALKKAQQDSISRVNAAIAARQKEELAAREKLRQDSIAKVKAEMAAAKTKAREDSVLRAKEKLERLAIEQALKKAQQDSINRVNAAIAARQKEEQAAREKQRQDSIARVKAEITAARLQARQDSISRAKAEQELKTRELAAKKATQDSINRVKAEIAAREKAEQEKRAKDKQDSINWEKAKAAAAKARAREDSLASANAEKERARVLKEKGAAAEALRKTQNDSIAKVKLYAEAKQLQDSLQKVKDYNDRVAVALAKRKEKEERERLAAKAAQDSIENAQREQEAATKLEAEKKAKELARVRVEKAVPVEPKAETAVIPEASRTEKPDYTKLPALQFAKNDYALSEPVKTELKTLAQQLIAQPNLSVNLYAFGSADENNAQQSSLRRSDMVLRFLSANGVGMGRVTSFHYGSSQSRSGCTSPMCPEELQQQNRVVVYQVVAK